jgi:hypothetical protein
VLSRIPQINITLQTANLRPESKLTRPSQISALRLVNCSDGLHLNSSLLNLPIRLESLVVPWRRGAAAGIMRSLPALCQSLHSYAKHFDETGYDDEGYDEEG